MQFVYCEILFPAVGFLDENTVEEISLSLFEKWPQKNVRIDFSEEQNAFFIYAEGNTAVSLDNFLELLQSVAGYFEPVVACWQDQSNKRIVSQNSGGVALNQQKPKFEIKADKIKLWVDDIRDPIVFTGETDWIWVKTAEEAWWVICNHNVEQISLDHDLGETKEGKERKSGYDLVKWIERKGAWPSKGARVHSDNSVGVKNMVMAIEKSGKYKKRGNREFLPLA